jgi:beige protein homolog 1
MGENDADVVVTATKIMARLVVTHGLHYSKKLADKTGGYTIMRYRLKNWWNDPTLWAICLAILLGVDVALLDLEAPFNLSETLASFISKHHTKLVFPEMIPVITEMLQTGMKSALDLQVHDQVQKGDSKFRPEQHLAIRQSQSDNSGMALPRLPLSF